MLFEQTNNKLLQCSSIMVKRSSSQGIKEKRPYLIIGFLEQISVPNLVEAEMLIWKIQCTLLYNVPLSDINKNCILYVHTIPLAPILCLYTQHPSLLSLHYLLMQLDNADGLYSTGIGRKNETELLHITSDSPSRIFCLGVRSPPLPMSSELPSYFILCLHYS